MQQHLAAGQSMLMTACCPSFRINRMQAIRNRQRPPEKSLSEEQEKDLRQFQVNNAFFF
jgi:hypothetical protein